MDSEQLFQLYLDAEAELEKPMEYKLGQSFGKTAFRELYERAMLRELGIPNICRAIDAIEAEMGTD